MARWIICLLMLMPQLAHADGPSLFAPAAERGPLFAARGPVIARASAPSLFDRAPGTGLFAPLAPRGSAMTGGVGQLFDLIASAEAGPAGYDAVQHGARIRPSRPPTQLRVGEILDWIAATPGQPHAIGRYQFIPATLRRLLRDQGVGTGERFSPALQDRLALQLLREAGLDGFLAGTMGRRAFMGNLAKVWAGLPLPSNRSYYQGHAGNRATLSWAVFEDRMQAIFPGSRA